MTLYVKESYSGKEVIKAGEYFLCHEKLNDLERYDWAMSVVSYWRFQHENSLELALTLLEQYSQKIDKNAIFAKRLKRHPSIVSKLHRFPKMKLKNMQDIGGCRAIVSNQKKLYQIVKELRHRTEFKNTNGHVRFKDYIETPKPDGYRGYHLVGVFRDVNKNAKSIELQLRTKLQHDWATALEIVDLFTGQSLKSDKGEEDWKLFFRLVSDHFSLIEGIHLYRSKSLSELLVLYKIKLAKTPDLISTASEIHRLVGSLSIVKKLEAFSHSLRIADKHISEREVHGYVLLKVDTKKSNIELKIFRDDQNSEAEKMYLFFEKETSQNNDVVIALVSTTAVGGIKEAYPNYFADSSEFLKYLILILKAQEFRKPNFMMRLLIGSGLSKYGK